MERKRSFWMLLAFVGLVWSALTLAACSSDSSSPQTPVDGDSENSDGEHGDGDLDDTTDGDLEWPEQEPFVWEDDTIDRWSWTPFCNDGIILKRETFDEGASAEQPPQDALASWTSDPTVVESGDPSKSVDPVLVYDGEQRGWVLSGMPDDTESDLPVRRLYLPIAKETNAFRFYTRLPQNEGGNYFWLNHDDDPTGYFGPQIQLHHDGEVSDEESEAEPQIFRIRDESEVEWCHADGFGDGWHLVELYRQDSAWRMDIDRATVCEFSKTIDRDRNLTYLFIGLSGYMDEIVTGNCSVPAVGRSCAQHSDCGIDEVCGRDKVCHPILAYTCRSRLQCVHDDDQCVGVYDGNMILGDGTCSRICTRHADCRPSELCLPHSRSEGACHVLCGDGESCPEGQSCYEVGRVSACVPDDCKIDGHWEKTPEGLLSCECDEGFTVNPFNNRCENLGTCEKKADCDAACDQDPDCRRTSEPLACGEDGICYRNRDVRCIQTEDCTTGTSCFTHYVNGSPAGIRQCQASCSSNSDCQSYERCVPSASGGFSCLQSCTSNADCAASMSCVEGYEDESYCMPESCQDNGVWAWDKETSAYACSCINNTAKDPITGRCL